MTSSKARVFCQWIWKSLKVFCQSEPINAIRGYVIKSTRVLSEWIVFKKMFCQSEPISAIQNDIIRLSIGGRSERHHRNTRVKSLFSSKTTNQRNSKWHHSSVGGRNEWRHFDFKYFKNNSNLNILTISYYCNSSCFFYLVETKRTNQSNSKLCHSLRL